MDRGEQLRMHDDTACYARTHVEPAGEARKSRGRRARTRFRIYIYKEMKYLVAAHTEVQYIQYTVQRALQSSRSVMEEKWKNLLTKSQVQAQTGNNSPILPSSLYLQQRNQK